MSLIRHVNVDDNEWKSKRILDFGCGTGLLTEKLAPLVREVIAVDTSPNMIDVLRRKEIGNVTTICTDIGGGSSDSPNSCAIRVLHSFALSTYAANRASLSLERT